jgi:hypothetical protein
MIWPHIRITFGLHYKSGIEASEARGNVRDEQAEQGCLASGRDGGSYAVWRTLPIRCPDGIGIEIRHSLDPQNKIKRG